MKFHGVVLAIGLTTAFSAEATTYNGFEDHFSLEGASNWNILEAQPGDVELYPADDVVALWSSVLGPKFDTSFTIDAPEDGTVTFGWSWYTYDVDGAFYDPFGYINNGIFTQLTDDNGNSTVEDEFGWYQSGYVSFDVLDQTIFGFQITNLLGGAQPGLVAIYDFKFEGAAVSTVPLPAAAWLFLSALAGLTGVRRLKHQSSSKSNGSQLV